VQRLDYERETLGQVVAGSAVEPHAIVVLAGDDAKAVMLDLVHQSVPVGGYGALVGRHGGTKPSGSGMGSLWSVGVG
jgi:hypothetical protein